jgi:predicted nuclease with TOPRIM domain
LEEENDELKDRFQQLKAHAQEKLKEANEEIANMQKSLENELTAMKVRVKRLEMENSALERNLEGKTLENVELLAICDNLEQLCGK